MQSTLPKILKALNKKCNDASDCDLIDKQLKDVFAPLALKDTCLVPQTHGGTRPKSGSGLQKTNSNQTSLDCFNVDVIETLVKFMNTKAICSLYSASKAMSRMIAQTLPYTLFADQKEAYKQYLISVFEICVVLPHVDSVEIEIDGEAEGQRSIVKMDVSKDQNEPMLFGLTFIHNNMYKYPKAPITNVPTLIDLAMSEILLTNIDARKIVSISIHLNTEDDAIGFNSVRFQNGLPSMNEWIPEAQARNIQPQTIMQLNSQYILLRNKLIQIISAISPETIIATRSSINQLSPAAEQQQSRTEQYVSASTSQNMLQTEGSDALLSAIKSLRLSENPIHTLIANYRLERNAPAAAAANIHQLGAGSPKQKQTWTSTRQKFNVKQKGDDGKFHIVRRTAYHNPSYPEELRIAKVKDGKRIFVKFVRVLQSTKK